MSTSYALDPGPRRTLSQAEWGTAGNVFRSLGSTLRVGILALLRDRPHSVSELVDELRVSQPLVSQHLRVLRSVKLVRGVRQGREVIYELSDERVGVLLDVVGGSRPALELVS